MAQTQVQFASDRLAKLQGAVADFLNRSQEPSREFTFSIGWCRSYETLFQGRPFQTTPIGDVVKQALETGRVLISGKGGAAKTVIIRRLARQSLESNHLPVVLDLKKWTSLHYTRWHKLENTIERINYLFSSLDFPQFSVMQLDALPPHVVRLIFVDGLNEVTSNTGQDIIGAIDDYAQYAIQTGVVVADRMVRRLFLDSNRWGLCTVLPLQSDEVKRQLMLKFGDSLVYDQADPSTRALLSTPYFLNSLLEENTATGHTSSETIHRYFTNHASLSEEEIDAASGAAYHAYENYKSRTFPLNAFRDEAGIQATQKLIDTKALLLSDGLGSFDHHLKHDFLASRYVVSDPQRWSPGVLGILTFDAGSFDALFLALQQTSSTDSADLLIRRIYDWNLYGAAYALTEGGSLGTTRVSLEMETVIITMLAQRQWDLMRSTQTKAKDALSLFPADRISNFLSARKIEDLSPIVKNIESNKPWFDDWKSLFTLSAVPDLGLITEEDSLLGWTVANVLKRLPLSEASQKSLREFIDNADPTVRWRIVHVLGSFPSEQNAECLFARLDRDDDHWVRYGATRSLVEMAAIGQAPFREGVFGGIKKRAVKLKSDDKSLREFELAVFIDPKRAPENWVKSLASIIETLYNLESTFEKREHWRQIAFCLKADYGFPQN